MKNKRRMVVTLLVAFALLSTASFGCGEKEEAAETEIIIGLITDMTGPASSLLVVGERAYYDSVDLLNREDPIPGAKIKIISFDSRYDPSRDIAGYEWLKERGADFIYTGIPTVGDTLKETAARDKFPIITSSPSLYAVEPPGWVLGVVSPTKWVTKGFLKWLAEENWDYETEGRKPKIGSAGWDEPYQRDATNAIREYVSDHPDQFELGPTFLTPMGGLSWFGEVEALKDSDYVYIPSTGLGTATFAKDYRDRGFTGTFIGLDAMGAFLHLLEEKVGWEGLDGSLTAHTTPYWTDEIPTVEEAKALLTRYHPDDKDEIIRNGLGYISMYYCFDFVLDLIRKTVEDVGIENFNGEALYNSAQTFNWYREGLPERGYGFTDTIRYARKDLAVYQWKASIQDLERISDWVPADVQE